MAKKKSKKTTNFMPMRNRNFKFLYRRLMVFMTVILFTFNMGYALQLDLKASEESTITFKETPAPAKTTTTQKGIFTETYEGFMESFSKDLSLNVVLGEIFLLIIALNFFALMNKPRLILVTSYIFCLKWVLWSNYTTLLKHSDAITVASTTIFMICGMLTIILFCMNRFEVIPQER
jgi:hypothetical protein